MSRWLGIFSLLLMEAIIISFLYSNHEQKENQVLDKTLNSLQMSFDAALKERDTIMRLALQGVILHDDVLTLLSQGISAQDVREQVQLRNRLYQKLLPTYQYLITENILQLQFHTKEGMSYLRFDQPEKFGDLLSFTRPSIEKIMQSDKVVKGFEVGDVEGGFHFIYPLFLASSRIGSVEINSSFYGLRKSMLQLAPNYGYVLLTHQNTVKKMTENQQLNYKPSLFNSDYLIEISEESSLNSASLSASLSVLSQQLKQKPKLQLAMRNHQPIATCIWAESHWYTVALMPIEDVQGKQAGYLLSTAVSSELQDIKKELWISICISVLLTLILGIFLWRAQRESQFRDEQQRQMTIISDTMADGLYVTDENGVITFFNSATATLLGYEGYELEGSMPRALFYIDRQGHRGIDPRDCPICQVLRTGKSFRGEWKFIRHDDSIFDVEVASQPIFQAHKLVGAVTVFRDVSERNEVKKEMVAAKELAEQASATKSAFLANMSHEIRTPMNGVLGMTAMLQETPLSDIQKDYVQTIRSSGDALLTVIDDILDYSKIEAGMMTIESSPFDIRALFKDVQRLMQFRANQKNLLLSLRVTDAVPQIVLGDSVRVRQILLNLIGNAIKFTDQGSVEVLALLTHHEGDLFTIRIEVSDTGIGIAEDKIGRLFKSFSQVDDSTTRRFGGTGLGLSISKRLAELMKGEMGASSAEGQGSVFWFTLLVQAAEEQPVTLTRATETVQNLPPATILLVEDNLVNQKVAAAMLGKLGYKPTIANNGKEALALMQEQDYDLIFMDCQMPVMDGFEATRAIRAGIAGGNNTQLTVIALTANAMKEDKDACYAAGMSDYLAKPLQMPLLIAMLKKHLVEVSALTSKL